jgi:hypothetical protein
MSSDLEDNWRDEFASQIGMINNNYLKFPPGLTKDTRQRPRQQRGAMQGWHNDGH